MAKDLLQIKIYTTNYTRELLQITLKNYYILHQIFITNYCSSNFLNLLIIYTSCVKFYYKLQQFSKYYCSSQKLLQLIAGITNCSINTN